MTIEADAPPLNADATGTIRVGGTRVTLDTVVGEFLDGATAEAIADAYPAVSLADVYATIGYYLRHRESVDEYLRAGERAAAELRREIEAMPGHAELRRRLVAIKHARGGGPGAPAAGG